MDENHFSLSVFCANVHCSNPITHTILQTHSAPSSDISVIIITEPWIGTVCAETNEKGTVKHPDWHCIMPSPIHSARVALYYKKSAPFRAAPLIHSPFSSRNILPVCITMDDSFSLLLLAVYNSPTSFEASNLLQGCTLPEEPTILCGDFNLHAPDWDSTVQVADNHANTFQDWMMDNSFTVLNNPDLPTYHGHHFEHQKVDDLVIANTEVYLNYDITPVESIPIPPLLQHPPSMLSQRKIVQSGQRLPLHYLREFWMTSPLNQHWHHWTYLPSQSWILSHKLPSIPCQSAPPPLCMPNTGGMRTSPIPSMNYDVLLMESRTPTKTLTWYNNTNKPKEYSEQKSAMQNAHGQPLVWKVQHPKMFGNS